MRDPWPSPVHIRQQDMRVVTHACSRHDMYVTRTYDAAQALTSRLKFRRAATGPRRADDTVCTTMQLNRRTYTGSKIEMAVHRCSIQRRVAQATTGGRKSGEPREQQAASNERMTCNMAISAKTVAMRM